MGHESVPFSSNCQLVIRYKAIYHVSLEQMLSSRRKEQSRLVASKFISRLSLSCVSEQAVSDGGEEKYGLEQVLPRSFN